MGYEVHFCPSEEKMETYKPWGYGKANYEPTEKRIQSSRLQILTYCLKDHTKDGCYHIQKEIEFMLKLLSNELAQGEKESAYIRWLNDKDHDLWYCGWEFSHSSNHDPEVLLNDTVENLVILTDVVTTPDYFKDNDGFCEKRHRITACIDEFIEIMEEHYIHHIIDDLEEFREKDNDEIEEETVDETFARIADELLPTKKGKTDEENNEEEYGLMNNNGDKDFD